MIRLPGSGPLPRRRFLQWGALALAAPGLRAVAADPPGDAERDEALRRAAASVKAAAERVRDDPDRPAYHVLPPADWINDPNGPIFHKGYYHLFYQHNPYGDAWGNMHWGHVRSKDLAHWEHLPIALWPSKGRGEEHVFSGCATVTPTGQVMLIYTSIGNRLPEQWAALPEDDDLLRWRKHPDNPILTEKLHGDVKVHEWRDPFAFQADGRTYLVLGGNLNASKGGQAVVNVYRADNDELARWQYLGVLFRHPDASVKNIECPLFFPLGGKWVLIVSPHGPVQYFVGDLDAKAMRFKPEQRGIVDYGTYYAPNCLAEPDGRRLLWGWINGFPGGRGWNGCLSLPRVLSIGPDNTLRQEPAPELAKLRAGPGREENAALASTSMRLDVKGDALEVRADIEPREARAVGLRLRCPGEGGKGVPVTFDGKQLDVAGRKAPLTLGPDEKTLRLHVFLDRSVLEVYANGRACLACVIHPDRDALGVEAFAHGGAARVHWQAWELGSAWPTPRGKD
jgi:beta-fructofuranosidase